MTKFLYILRNDQLKKLRDIMVKKVLWFRDMEQEDGTIASMEQVVFSDQDDPDPNYVLTMDNAKKILAIHQRLR